MSEYPDRSDQPVGSEPEWQTVPSEQTIAQWWGGILEYSWEQHSNDNQRGIAEKRLIFSFLLAATASAVMLTSVMVESETSQVSSFLVMCYFVETLEAMRLLWAYRRDYSNRMFSGKE